MAPYYWRLFRWMRKPTSCSWPHIGKREKASSKPWSMNTHTHLFAVTIYIYIYHQMSNFHLEASRILSWGGFTNHPTQNISSHQQPTLDVRGESSHQFDPFFKNNNNNNNKSSRPLEKFYIRGQNSMWGKLGGFFWKKKEQSFWMRKKLLQRRYTTWTVTKACSIP